MAGFDASQRVIQYDTKELRRIGSVIRKMGDEAKDQAREVTGALTEYAVKEIQSAARGYPRPKQATRIADGIRISKSSTVGEFGIGFASIRFSGGATSQLREGMTPTNGILAGVEFGARKVKHFLPPVLSQIDNKASTIFSSFIFGIRRRTSSSNSLKSFKAFCDATC